MCRFNIEKREEFFKPTQRSYIVSYILRRTPFLGEQESGELRRVVEMADLNIESTAQLEGPLDEQTTLQTTKASLTSPAEHLLASGGKYRAGVYGLDNLLADGTYMAAFPLHDSDLLELKGKKASAGQVNEQSALSKQNESALEISKESAALLEMTESAVRVKEESAVLEKGEDVSLEREHLVVLKVENGKGKSDPFETGKSDALENGKSWMREKGMRQLLFEHWASWRNLLSLKLQPLDQIRDYLGEQFAFYFAWLGFYTLFLLPAALVGILVFLYGLYLVFFMDPPDPEMCAFASLLILIQLCRTVQWAITEVLAS